MALRDLDDETLVHYSVRVRTGKGEQVVAYCQLYWSLEHGYPNAPLRGVSALVDATPNCMQCIALASGAG